MKKRLLSAVLCSVMVMSLFACGNGDAGQDGTTTASKNENPSSSEALTEATTTVKPVTSEEEAITKDPIFFEDFNGDDQNITVVYHENYSEDTGAPLVAGTMPTADAAAAAGKTALLQTDESKDGTNALFLDGTYGAILDCTFAGDTPSYTLSFWVNEQRLGCFGTLATIGKDMLTTNNDTAWINITMNNTWLGYEVAPCIWSRSMKASYEVNPTGDGGNVWPWYVEAYCFAAEENRVSKKEWHMVTIVVDGTIPGRDPVTELNVDGTVQGITYIDGQLYGLGPVANYVVDASTQVFMGINCWDMVTKGYYDDIAVYDYALTPGQVYGLYNAQKGE